MKHVHSISRMPKPARDIEICTDIANDFQAQLCFVVELLISFALPLLS